MQQRLVAFLLGLMLACGAGLAMSSDALAHGAGLGERPVATALADMPGAADAAQPAGEDDESGACHHGSLACGSAPAIPSGTVPMPLPSAMAAAISGPAPKYHPTVPWIQLPPPRF